MFNRRSLLKATAAAPVLGAMPFGRARAQGATLKIGVLNDMSGVYRDISGPTSVAAVKQAIEDFGASGKGLNVEVVFADHQNKPDIASSVTRQWIDRDGVDLIVDVPNSACALAVTSIVREKNKAYINSTGGTVDLTGSACTPNMVHWAYDTWMLANSTGGAMVKAGGDSWFFITADYAFGHSLEQNTAGFVTRAGGKVLGNVRTPFPGTTDFSSYLVQAQASGAKVIGLANAGLDTVNCVKQAAEFGITRRGVKLAGLLVFINDIHALGLQAANGMVLSESFYWDMNERTRAFTQRLVPKTNGNYPAMSHAGCYAGTLHYLKAAADIGYAKAKASGSDVIARMKAMPTDDDAFGVGSIRPDGRKIQPVYLFEVKKPEESKGPWDYYKLIATTPADQAYRPMSEGGCSLVR